MSVLRLDWRLPSTCTYLPAPGSAFMSARGNNRWRSRAIERGARLGLWESEGGALDLGAAAERAARYEAQSVPKMSL